ncbi:MAG TPA: molybdopterin cofactor-binding domain-containing protein, partial [Rectinemataceae bacterium]
MKTWEDQESLPSLSTLKLPGMVYAATVRSPVPRAKHLQVLDVDLPPGYTLLVPGRTAGFGPAVLPGGIPCFATDEISYIGQPLGLVAGSDPGICDELARSVRVEYREEEATLEWESFSSSQIVYSLKHSWGEPEEVFASGHRLLRATYRTGAFDHRYAEPIGALAAWDYDKLAIYCASQWPSHLRAVIARAMSVEQRDIVIKPTYMGPALDGKLWYPSLTACQAAMAARALGKPVKILYDREEDYLHTSKQARSIVSIASATDQGGRLQALDIRFVINIGAYNYLAEELVRQASAAMTGIYDCPAVRIEAYAVRSDVVPLGALGGIGAGHAFFAIEAHMNHLAQLHGMTPVELKAINMLTKKNSSSGQESLDKGIPFGALHGKLETISDYRRKFASYELVRKRNSDRRGGPMRGIALTLGYQSSTSHSPVPGMRSYSLELLLDRNRNLTIGHSTAPPSESLEAMLKKTASEALSIPEEKIHFKFVLPESGSGGSGPLTLSRGASVLNTLVERGCKNIQSRRFRESLPILARVQSRNPGSRSEGDWREDRAKSFEHASWCGTAVEIEVDRLTGEPFPLAVWMVIDAGRIVLPERAKASLRTSVMTALRLCTDSAFSPEGGRAQYLDSWSRRERTPPLVEIEFVDPDKGNRARGIGELPFVTIPAAFYSAL